MQLNQVVTWYLSTPAYARLGISTQDHYSRYLKRGLDLLGNDRNVNDISAMDADALYIGLTEESLPKAVTVCKVMSIVWNLLIRIEKADRNPFQKMRMETLKRRTTVWTPEQVSAFIYGSASIGLPSMGLIADLCYNLCQRPGDMRQLKWSNYTGTRLNFNQEKTGTYVSCFVPSDLKEILDGVERVGPYIATREDTLQPYSRFDVYNYYLIILDKVGLPHTLQMRDLRRTGLTEMGENEATDAELQSVSGIKTRALLNVYQIGTEKLAENAAKRRVKSN